MPGDEVDDPLLDVRPDRGAPLRAARAAPDRSPVGSPSSVRSATGTTTSRSHSFAAGGWTTSTGRPPARKRATSSTGRTVADRPTRWAGRLEERVEPLEAEREVGAALGPGEGVDLVDDDRLHAGEGLPGSRGEQEEERLGRRDEDVGGRPGEGAALVGRGVAGADRDRRPGHGEAEPGRGVADADQRGAEVALDVDGERLHRRDVEDAAPPEPSAGGGSAASRSSAQRNADSVLPEPVGATTRAWCPELIAAQAPAWAAVGASKLPRNQAAVGGRTGRGRRRASSGARRPSGCVPRPASVSARHRHPARGPVAQCLDCPVRSASSGPWWTTAFGAPTAGRPARTHVLGALGGRTAEQALGGRGARGGLASPCATPWTVPADAGWGRDRPTRRR